MGATCCHETNKEGLIFEVSDVPRANQYSEAEWPEQDQFLKMHLSTSDIYATNKLEKPLKHKVYDRWYWGDWINGQPCGKGILYFRGDYKSILYEGDFQGEPEGTGKVYFNEGEAVYEGEISKSRANGMGRYVNHKDGSIFDGEWKDSIPYKGEIQLYKSQTANGNQEKSVTVIKIDEESHKNQIHYPDGRVYCGEIDKGRYIPNGIGKVTFPNKSFYEGDWEHGEMHGRGKFQWSDNSYYEGQYLFGKKHGEGRFVFASGNYYDGFWVNGKQNGRGILYSKDYNEIKNGYWKDGQFVGTSKPIETSP